MVYPGLILQLIEFAVGLVVAHVVDTKIYDPGITIDGTYDGCTDLIVMIMYPGPELTPSNVVVLKPSELA